MDIRTYICTYSNYSCIHIMGQLVCVHTYTAYMHIVCCTVKTPNEGHLEYDINISYFVLCREVFHFGSLKMYCRNYTGTISHVLCREVYYTVSSFGRVHYQRCTVTSYRHPYIQYILNVHIHTETKRHVQAHMQRGFGGFVRTPILCRH